MKARPDAHAAFPPHLGNPPSQAALAKSGGGGGDAALLCMLGLCQVSQGDLAEGIATYDRALAIDPGGVEPTLNLGMALKEIGWVARAEEVGGCGGGGAAARRVEGWRLGAASVESRVTCWGALHNYFTVHCAVASWEACER